MRFVFLETTPNPNSMKLNFNAQLGATATYTAENSAALPAATDSAPPEFVQRLLEINGIESVFVCGSFITLNKDPRADWRLILEQATLMFATDSASAASASDSVGGAARGASPALVQAAAAAAEEGRNQVFVQTFRGVPIQVKVVDNEGESRVSLGDRFNEAAQLIQEETGANFLEERYWAEHGVRYGSRADVADEMAAELQGTLDGAKLQRLVDQALGKAGAKRVSREECLQWLQHTDWQRRLAAVQELSNMDDALSLLMQSLADANPQVRRLAAASLGARGSAVAVPSLIDAMLHDEHAGVRRTAGDALSDIGDASAEAAMCQALSDTNKLVRWRAARFLADMGTEHAIPFLQQAGDDAAFEVRLEAQSAIERIQGGDEKNAPAWKRIVENI